VRERVKPERDPQTRDALRIRWWQYAEKRPGLYQAIYNLDRVLAVSRIGKHAAFTFLPAGMIYHEKIVVFPREDYAAFCVLQSRVHELWTRFFSTTLKDDLQYTPSDCAQNFPIPVIGRDDEALEDAGRSYFDARAQAMQETQLGLTSL